MTENINLNKDNSLAIVASTSDGNQHALMFNVTLLMVELILMVFGRALENRLLVTLSRNPLELEFQGQIVLQ